MAEITIKITHTERVTCREVLDMVKATLPEGFSVALERADFGKPEAPTRRSTAAKLITLAGQMDGVAGDMEAIAYGGAEDCAPYESSEEWAILSRAIELRGAADMARGGAAEIAGERS